MFRRLPDHTADLVRIEIDDVSVAAHRGDSVAAAVLAAGKLACRRSAVSGEPRGPYCMMGVCFECLVEVDGVRNRQGCLLPVCEGMRIVTGSGRTEVPP